MERKKISIGLSPFLNHENTYTERTKEILEKIADISPIPNVREIAKNPKMLYRLKFDYSIVNWLDNGIVSRSSGNISYLGIVKFIINVIFLKYISNKTIFVRHNNYPHHTKLEYATKVSRLLDFFEKWFDLSITHSGHNTNQTRIYIPHPLYSGYKKSELLDTKSDYFLIFGRILPYKKIKEFIEKKIGDEKIIIAGPCNDENYLKVIKNLAKGKNIDFLIGFIEEKEAENLVSNSNGLILSHAESNVIVSGSYFFATSLGTPVYSIETPFLKWLSIEKNAIGLTLSKSIEDLQIDLSRKKIITPRALIKNFALENFDDALILKKWSSILIDQKF